MRTPSSAAPVLSTEPILCVAVGSRVRLASVLRNSCCCDRCARKRHQRRVVVLVVAGTECLAGPAGGLLKSAHTGIVTCVEERAVLPGPPLLFSDSRRLKAVGPCASSVGRVLARMLQAPEAVRCRRRGVVIVFVGPYATPGHARTSATTTESTLDVVPPASPGCLPRKAMSNDCSRHCVHSSLLLWSLVYNTVLGLCSVEHCHLCSQPVRIVALEGLRLGGVLEIGGGGDWCATLRGRVEGRMGRRCGVVVDAMRIRMLRGLAEVVHNDLAGRSVASPVSSSLAHASKILQDEAKAAFREELKKKKQAA
ncbi:hypothetical protein DFP72DRAFT_1076710 [Ephemerocybe angulata]|uniref:Uncharacterized protein n=1 Tax=Ephemerocybe angulata TaxID=980116 RepID=A0A8H6LXX5_9AGAR|nr:hypothetical protein DFP72DRAFT_1076710 [Tulosesus angulatus]